MAHGSPMVNGGDHPSRSQVQRRSRAVDRPIRDHCPYARLDPVPSFTPGPVLFDLATAPTPAWIRAGDCEDDPTGEMGR